jgi:MFS family permease
VALTHAGGERDRPADTGWLSNHFGRKRLLIMSLLGFTTSSFLCGLSLSLPMLILFRIAQGATGGALQPISQAVLLEAFPPSERGKAMGFWGLGIVVAPILGPVLGRWLTDSYSWRWVFYINVPVACSPSSWRACSCSIRLTSRVRRNGWTGDSVCWRWGSQPAGRARPGRAKTVSLMLITGLILTSVVAWAAFVWRESPRDTPWSTCASSRSALRWG